MAGFFGDYLQYFGEIKFGEENNMCISDFEKSFKKYFSKGNKKPRGRYKFGEINNPLLKSIVPF